MYEEIVEKLKQVSLFKNIKDDVSSLEKVASVIEIKNFDKGSNIIKEGDQGDEMYILSKGRVRIEKRTLQDESYTVTLLEDGMNIFFGELALMDNDQRSATVIAETDCECYVIKKDKFDTLGNVYPHIGLTVTREIARTLSSRLRRTNQDIITLFEALVGEIEKT